MPDIIKLPSIPLPIPGKVHPSVDIEHQETDRFQQATLDYCDRFALYHSEEQRQRMRAVEHASCSAWMYPRGADELVQLGSDFTLWAFAYDDEYCDEGPLSNDPAAFMQKSGEILRAMDCPEDPPCSEDKYALAAQDMRRRLDLYAKPAQVARFVEAFRWYITIEILKINQLKPTLNDHLYMRLYAGGGMAFPVLAHVIADIDISQTEYEDRRVRALTEMLAMLMVIDTEPFAYGKETARAVNDKEHNIVQIFCRDYRCTFDEAIERYLDMRWRIMSLYFRLREEVMKDASQGLRDYIDSVALYYKGGATWMLGCKRYLSVTGLANSGLVGDTRLIDDGPPESFEAVDVPCLAWWWSHDPARQPGYRAATNRLTPERHLRAA